MTNEYFTPEELREPTGQDIQLAFNQIRRLAQSDQTLSIILQQAYSNINEVVLAEMVMRLIDDKAQIAALAMHLHGNRPAPSFTFKPRVEP
jgi:hypothetical protein